MSGLSNKKILKSGRDVAHAPARGICLAGTSCAWGRVKGSLSELFSEGWSELNRHANDVYGVSRFLVLRLLGECA